MTDLTGWTLSEKWHRVSLGSAETYCGLPAASEPVEVQMVLDDTRANRTSVCGTCDKIAADLRGGASASAPGPDRLARLTPEQVEILARRQEEQVRRARVRLAADQDHGGRSDRPQSVRTVSGGLPGLGRRGK